MTSPTEIIISLLWIIGAPIPLLIIIGGLAERYIDKKPWKDIW